MSENYSYGRKKEYEYLSKAIGNELANSNKSKTAEFLATNAMVAEKNKQKADELYGVFNRLASQPGSAYYDPYRSATNNAVGNLETIGFDTKNLSKSWINQNQSWIQSNLLYNGTTTTPSKPGKKATANQQLAYWLYQWDKSEDQTEEAENEWNSLQRELSYWANRKDLNLSDDEIISNIDWKKYKTLSKMDETRNGFQPLEMNRAVGYSQDALRGVLWQARNNKYDTSIDEAIGLSQIGAGEYWKEDPEIQKLRKPLLDDNKTINPDFNPYTLGSTGLDDEGLYFDMLYFPENWTADNVAVNLYGTEEDKKHYKKVETAEANYRSAEKAVTTVCDYINSFINKGETNPETLKGKFDDALAAGKLYVKTDAKGNVKFYNAPGKDREEIDLGILNALDATMGKNGVAPNGSLVPMTRGLNYKYDDFVGQIYDVCANNTPKEDDTDTQNSMIEDAAGAYSGPTASGYPAPAGPVATGASVAGASTAGPTTTGPVDNSNKATGPSWPSYPADAGAKAAQDGRLSSPTDLLAGYTDTDKEQIKAKNENIKTAAGTVADQATDNELTVMNNAGSVAFLRGVSTFNALRTRPFEVQAFTNKATDIASKNLVKSGLDSTYKIAEYEQKQKDYDASIQRFNQLYEKYGSLDDLNAELNLDDEVTMRVGDVNVVMHYQKPTRVRGKHVPGKYVVDSISGEGISNIKTYKSLEEFRERFKDARPDLVSQVDEAIKAEDEETLRILSAHGNAKLAEGGKEIEEYKQLNTDIKNLEEYLKENKETYDKGSANLKKQVEKMALIRDAMIVQGLDPTAADEAFDFLTGMLQFHDEPRIPNHEMSKLQYLNELEKMTGKHTTFQQKGQILHENIRTIDKRLQQIDDLKAYAERTGNQIPASYARNMRLMKEDLEAEKKAFEYSAILTDTDPDELRAAVEAGKAFEKEYAPDDIANWRGSYYLTEDDMNTYYYLLGKKVQELGDEFAHIVHDAPLGEWTDYQATQDMLQEIYKDADAYTAFMSDDTYGVWTHKADERSRKRGKELVDSGPVLGTAANLGATLLTPAETIMSAIYGAKTAAEGGRINPESRWRLLSNFKEGVREATFASIDNTFKDNPTAKWFARLGYEVYVNHGDSVMNSMLLGAMLPPGANAIVSELLGAAPMGLNAAMSAAADAVENGANTDQAWFIFGTTFLAETVSEAITFSNIQEALGTATELTKESLKDFAIDWLTRSGIEEMVGETLTEGFENEADQLAALLFDNPNYESQHQKLIDHYYTQGYTKPGEAEAKAAEDEVKNLVHTMIVSYVSAGTNIMISTGKAALNTAKTAVDVIDAYRTATRADQRLGGSSSILGNMMNDLAKRNTNTRRPVVTAPGTATEASAQEAGAAAPENNAAPAAELSYEEVKANSDAAKVAFDAATVDERKKHKTLAKAKKDQREAVKSGDQAKIEKAQAEVLAAQQEYDAARQAKEDAKNKRNDADKALMRAEEIIVASEASPEQKQAAADVAAIERVSGSTQTTQTEMIASILDNGDGEETVTEQASAAATFLPKILGEDTSYVVQQAIAGTVRTGISRETVTTALQNAALGNGAATAVVQSEAFRNATPEEKAQMLAETVDQDQNDPMVQQNIANSVKDFRIGMGINDLAANGHFDQANKSRADADKAARATGEARTLLKEKQNARDAAQESFDKANESFMEDPGDNKRLIDRESAGAALGKADETQHQYEQHLDNTVEAQKTAEAKAEKDAQDAMVSARETVEQGIQQQDQQRAEEAAQKAAEKQQRQAEQARMQAEEDERTGKAAEDRRNETIEQILDQEGLEEGEDRDKRRKALIRQAERIKLVPRTLGKKISNSEGMLALYAFERKIGTPIVFTNLGAVDSKRITRGRYVVDKETGQAQIQINKNLVKSGKMTVGQAIVEAALHEITHRMQGTKTYQAYRKVVLDSLYGGNGDTKTMYDQNDMYRAAVDSMIADRLAAKDEYFVGKSHDDQVKAAEEELIADFARMNLTDKDVVQRFMDNGMGGRMRNTLHNINQALRNFADTLLGRSYKEWEEEARAWNEAHKDNPDEQIDIQGQEEFYKNMEYLRRAERAFQKAMNEAAATDAHDGSSQMSVTQMAESMNIGAVVDGERLDLYIPDENGSIVGNGQNGLQEGVRYSLVDGDTVRITPDKIVNTPIGMLIDMGLDGTEFVGQDGNTHTQKGDAMQMFADLMNLCAKYKDNNLIWEIAGSEFSEAFSALKSNSDPQYRNTVDFGTICSKTQAIVDVLSQTMIERINTVRERNDANRKAWIAEHGTLEGFEPEVFTGLNREDIMEVYNRTHNAGLSVPCPVCYVFSRWMGVPSMLGQINRFQNQYVNLSTDENGNVIYDEKGDAVVDWDKTFQTANSYLQRMVNEYTKTKDNPDGVDLTNPNLTEEERKEAIKIAKDKIADQKNSINNKKRTRIKNRPKLYEQLGILQEKLENPNLKPSERKKIEGQIEKKQAAIDKNIRESDQFDEDLKEYEAFNWVSQVLCVQHSEGRSTVNDLDENGNFVMDKENFRYTPEEILFDLNRSGEFAGYAKNWRYRTTRGAGMGKAIMPYSGESIGDMINGSAVRWQREQNPFLNMDRDAAVKAFEAAKKRVKQQNLVGGQRFQSTSDFRPEWGLDYIMSFLEMQALGSKVQMYTKVVEAVDFLGSIGADVNCSIMGRANGFHEATADEIRLAESDTEEGRELKSRMGVVDGTTYVMDFSDVTGMDYSSAKAKSKKFNSVQMILVGMNDVHIKLALGNQDIDFVIPWHSSGNSKDVLQQLVSSVGEALEESSDYTDTQTDKIKSHEEGKGKNKKTIDDRSEAEIKLWDARVKLLSEGGEALTEEERRILLGNDFTKELYKRFTAGPGQEGYDPDCYKVKLPKEQAEQIFPYEYWDKNSTRENADVNGKRFVDYCDALGMVPRFSQFKDVPGYWKLLIDRKMYDNNVLNEDGTVKEYGKYREQNAVDVTKAKIENDPDHALDPETDKEKIRSQQLYQLPESTTARYGKKNYSEQTEAAIRTSVDYLNEKYDGHAQNSMYGQLTEADRDLMKDAATDYEDAVSRGDMEAAQEDVAYYAEQKGYTDEAYHGTKSFGFTKFNLKAGSGLIFVSYDRDLASTYTENGDVREIGTNVNNNMKFKTDFTDQELMDHVMGPLADETRASGTDIINVRKTGENEFTATVEYVGFNGETKQDEIQFTRNDIVSDYQKRQIESGETEQGIYHLYTRPGNQLVIDADGAVYGNIAVPWTDKKLTTGEIAEYARQNGYDSVRINNLRDGGDNNSAEKGIGDVGIFFSQDDVKSADTVTYDNQGNPISLDQRFTDSPDIRYSTSGQTSGQLTEADRDLMNERELNQTLVNGDAVTPEELEAYENRYHKRPLEARKPFEGPKQRAFGGVGGMLEKSDEIAAFAKAVVRAQNSYFPDTNNEQINRAVDWIKSLKRAPGSDGYAEALQKVTSDSFDYRSADGQARMVAVMGLAAAKNDLIGQAVLADAFNRQGTDLGRALQARKLFKLMTPEGRKETIRNMARSLNEELGRKGINADLKFSDWIYEAAAYAEDEGDMRKVQQAAAAELASQIPANWKDKLRGWRMLSMLGNPRTHIRNIVGNALFVPVVGMKNKVGALMELGLDKGKRTKTLRMVLPKSIREFTEQDASVMKDTLTGEAKYNEATMVDRQQKAFNGLLQVMIDFNSNALEKEDWIFLKGHYQRALGGWMQANGYTAEQLQENQSLLEQGRAYAIQEAQKATYRDFNQLAATLNKVSREGGVAGFLVDAMLPFKKTPANILRRGIEYSPVGIMRTLTADLYHLKQYKDYESGKLNVLPDKAITPNQFIDKLCSGLSGTAIMALGAILSHAGIVSGGFGDDEDELEKAKGNQKYAIKFNIAGHDFTYTMDWAAPMSMPFFVGAAIENQLSSERDFDIEELINAFGNITEPVFNLSMLDGINTLFKTSQYDDTNTLTQIGAKIGSNYATSYVPSLLGAIARVSDEKQRKAFVESGKGTGVMGTFRYAYEQVQNKIPGWNQTNIPVRDIWGQEKTSSLAERLIENFISPGYIEEYKNDPIINEMARLYEATGDAAMIPEGDPAKSITYKKEKYVLTAEQWDQYKATRNQTAFNELTELLNTDDYKNADDSLQVQMIKDVWSHADKVGRAAVIPDYELDQATVASISKDSKITGYKDKMIKALETGDYDGYETMVEALHGEEVEDSEIKSSIATKYRNQYKEAYRKGNYERMSEIEEILDNTGYSFDVGAWEDQVDEALGK